MKKKLLLFALSLSSLVVVAQEVIAPAGSSYIKTGVNIDVTVGEPVITTVSDGNNHITQGFHQTTWLITTIEDLDSNFTASFFPNPTSDYLHINVSSFKNITYQIIDANGKTVLRNLLTNDHNTVDVQHLATGTYYLILNNQSEKLKTFKLIKLK